MLESEFLFRCYPNPQRADTSNGLPSTVNGHIIVIGGFLG